MPNPTRLLRRRSKVDEAHVEIARSITMARLSSIFDPESMEAALPEEGALAAEGVGTVEQAGLPEGAPAEDVATAEHAGKAGDATPQTDPAPADDAAPAEPLESVDTGAMNVLDPLMVDVIDARQPVPLEAPTILADGSGAEPTTSPKPPRRAARPAAPRSRSVAARGRDARVASGPVAVIASCPYCALLLEPPPAADRRCTRCRQRIIVRRAHGRAVYLTEAAVQVFEAERRRVANTGRWTRDRERWLKLAASVAAPAGRIARLDRAVLSDEVVASARALYKSTVERLVRAAKRDRRWDDVTRLRRDEALAMHRAAGSPVPPFDEITALHREGALAALRGIGEIAREAALIGVGCCESCRADIGRQYRISAEVREPRLPHIGCPAGLCRCHWELTSRDRDVIGGYLRRHTRPDRVAPSV